MPSPDYINRIREQFRFFDDLDPVIRQALREAYYEWSPIDAMTEQHRCYGNAAPLEELAELYKQKDAQRFRNLMYLKLHPDESSTRDG